MCKGKLLVLTYYNRLTFTHISIIVVLFFIVVVVVVVVVVEDHQHSSHQ